jgi:hypothetical protein
MELRAGPVRRHLMKEEAAGGFVTRRRGNHAYRLWLISIRFFTLVIA